MKRKFRNGMSISQREAISRTLKNRKHSEEHKQKISESLKKYWAKLPYMPTDNENKTKNNE